VRRGVGDAAGSAVGLAAEATVTQAGGHVSVAASAFSSTFSAFSPFIKGTLESPAGAVVLAASGGAETPASRAAATDLAAEDRATKCLAALRAFEAWRGEVHQTLRSLRDAAAAASTPSAATPALSAATAAGELYEAWRNSLPMPAVVAAARPAIAPAASSSGGGSPGQSCGGRNGFPSP
jgi:hypothetical protein